MDGYVQGLLRSHEHSKALLQVGSAYGINFRHLSSNTDTANVINLGIIPYEKLERCVVDVPVGYESSEDEFNRIKEQVSVSFRDCQKFSGNATARLTGIHQFPKNNKHCPKLMIESADNDKSLCNMVLSIGEEATCYITFEIHPKFSGFLKRLLILTFDVTEEIDLLVRRSTSVTMGVMILGNITPRGLDKGLKMGPLSSKITALPTLSIDAKAFAPISDITMFDTPCYVINLGTCPQPLVDAFSPPPNFCRVITNPTLLTGAGYADHLAQELQYVRHLRGNTLQTVLDKLELCTVGDLIEKHSLSAALSYQYCQDLLSNHIKLINLEEIQMKIDIAQYDLHYVKLTATKKPPSESSSGGTFGTTMMLVKLKVRGSSENRPKICLGGEIMLRPVAEDLPILVQYGLNPAPFEIRGVCIHYQLSTEEAVFEFPGNVLPAHLSHVSFDRVFNALRFHVRFDYERYGYLFIQWAVSNIMQNKYLIESLFPNEDTIARLKRHFRESKTPPCPPGLQQQQKVPTQKSWAAIAAVVADHGASSPHSLPIDQQDSPGGGLSGSDQAATFNPQQLEAITAIGALVADARWTTVSHLNVGGSAQDFLPMPPFIIFGPPGTGKTSTVAEAILRICRTQASKRILACAPSDAAADVICERLARHLSTAQLFRLNWWQRVSASMPAKLRPYTLDVNDIFEMPSLAQLKSFQVIVCNCGTAGVLKTLQSVDSLTFDLVIVDEASQAIEAEILVPLELCKPSGLMVLSGDTNQLGPSTRCPLYPLCSDGASLQERLLRLPFYAACRPESVARSKQQEAEHSQQGLYRSMTDLDREQDSSRNTCKINLDALSVATSRSTTSSSSAASAKSRQSGRQMSEDDELPLGVFLYKNYRSHRAILEIPSQLFYGGALEECADRSRTGLVRDWDKLARSKPHGEAFPLLMIGVDGQHQHEVESPSFYNTAEIDKVVEVCRDLVSSPSMAPGTVTARDIGVIAAFRQQVLKLRLALRAAGLASVNVGSVEDFQGQEVKVVVISTVLSEWVDRYETKGAIGLIGDPKRFNVAVTRGMALCVVVGQPHLLYSDLHWRALLKYCIAHGAYTGMDIDHFMRRNRSRAGSVDMGTESGDREDLPHTEEASVEQLLHGVPGNATFMYDQEDEDLLNSVTEVANNMLMGESPLDSILKGSAVLGVLGAASRQGHYVRGYDMEWRNIL